jgi:hypothetical protein
MFLEMLVKCLDKLAAENAETELSGEKVVSELSSLALKLQLNADQSRLYIDK